MTKRQRQIWQVISEAGPRKPSYREIAARVGLRSVSTVELHMTQLEAQGVITRQHTKGARVRTQRRAYEVQEPYSWVDV